MIRTNMTMTSLQNKVASVLITANYHLSVRNLRFDVLEARLSKKKEREREG